MKLLVVTHKVMWVSTLVLASVYILAIWTIMPSGNATTCVGVELIAMGGKRWLENKNGGRVVTLMVAALDRCKENGITSFDYKNPLQFRFDG